MEIFSPRPYFSASVECDKYRPKVPIKTCPKRQTKNNHYSILKDEAKRYGISGNLIGLEASYADHVAAELAPYITGIVTCEKSTKLSKKLDDFYLTVNNIYKQHNLSFNIEFNHTDIFKYLKQSEYKPFGFFDFDFNTNLNEDILFNLIKFVPERVNGKSMISLWNSYGRGTTLLEHIEKIAYLIKELSCSLKVTELEPIMYDENMPMFLQILILEEKDNDY